jgi:hypothetical protein
MNDIEEYLDSLGIETAGSEHHHVRGGWIGLDCPECSPMSGSFRLGIELSTGRTNCWNCGIIYGPKAIAAAANRRYGEVKDAWNQVFKDAHLRVEDFVQHDGIYDPPKTKPLAKSHRKYLRRRGFEPESIERIWDISGIGPAAEYAYSIFIPILDIFGRPVSWTTRSLDDSGMRYCSSPPDREAAPLKSQLYGVHLAGHAIIVHEGPTDCWATGPGAIGTLGIAYTSVQLAKIAKFPVRTICFDSSPDAQKRAEAICKQLKAHPGITRNVHLESGEDPATAEKAELEELRLFLK